MGELRKPEPRVSVVIRARDEAGSIGRCLELVSDQETDFDVEVIVVNNGSRDATAAIAAAGGARVIELPREAFSFGGALNLGAANARGEIIVALSAHAFPLDAGWLARLEAAFEDPSVGCACADRYRPDGSALEAPVRYDAALSADHPDWGFSNAAGAFRAELWRMRPFRTDLPGCEDREWCRFWTTRGYVCLIDPKLLVDHDHTRDPLLSIYRRARREARGMAAFLGPAAPGADDAAALISLWWSDTRFYNSRWRARLSPRRAARGFGAYLGRKQGLGDWRASPADHSTGPRGGSSPNGTRTTRRRAWMSRR